MMGRILLLLCTGLLALCARAQSKADAHVHEGDRYFQQMAYARAVTEYTAAAELGAVNEHVSKRLAECHMKLGHTEEAEQWYATVVKFLNREPRDIYNYAEALKSNGRYAEAEEWMDKYLAMAAPEGAPKRSNISGFARKLTSDTDRFKLRTLGINTPYSDFGPAWLGTERILFASSRNATVGIERRAAWNDQPFLDLFVADRSGSGELSAPRVLEGSVNTKLHEGPASASTNGNVLWFTRNSYYKGRSQKSQNGISRLSIYKAYPSGSGWGGVEQFLYNNSEVSVGHPALSADGRSLYFVSDMPGGFGGSDIYVCHDQGGQWSEPENLGPAVNTPFNEVFPYLSAKGTLYFASNGHPGLGGLDVFAAAPLGGGGFRTAINVGAPVNGPKDDFGFIIDADERNGYFSSNRPGGMGDDDIYAFEMLGALQERFLCTGVVYDDEHEEQPVVSAEVQLFDMDGRMLGSTFTDARGEYSFPVDKDKAYRIVAKLAGHYDGEQHLSTENIEQQQIASRDIHLVADAGVWMRGTVAYKDRLGFIEGMSVNVVNMTSFFTENQLTGPGGDFSFRLQSNEEFEVLFEKAGFFSQSVPVSTVGMKQGVIDLNEARVLEFEPIELDSVIAFKHMGWTGNGNTLDPLARTELDALAERLLVNRQVKIEIEVHTDARATATDAQRLTQKQAETIVAYLATKGVPKDHMVARGHGNTRPLNHCVAGVTCTDAEHAVNRRYGYRVVEVKP